MSHSKHGTIECCVCTLRPLTSPLITVLVNFAVSLYPFGPGNGDQVLPSGDNTNSGLISLATPAVFYGKSAKDLIVST